MAVQLGEQGPDGRSQWWVEVVYRDGVVAVVPDVDREQGVCRHGSGPQRHHLHGRRDQLADDQVRSGTAVDLLGRELVQCVYQAGRVTVTGHRDQGSRADADLCPRTLVPHQSFHLPRLQVFSWLIGGRAPVVSAITRSPRIQPGNFTHTQLWSLCVLSELRPDGSAA
ncbi:hypothetical protein GCM10029964_027490 [Kibdelosporangium lantanae]